jgi:phosphatidylserine/phosphatidylglycerophosphate/cardiolipin synthase-like enzyme
MTRARSFILIVCLLALAILCGILIARHQKPTPASPKLALSTSAPITYTLYTFPETDKSITPLYALVNGAQKSIDMTMYALEDTTFTSDLLAACKRGVTVRVILDQNNEKSGNTSAFTQLNSQPNCTAVWANKAFEATHEKSFVVDGVRAAIMSLNLQSQYYSSTRDFAVLENDPADVTAIQATFNADFAAGTPSSGAAGPSDFSYTPGLGDHLIWSPTTAQTAMVNLIANAKKTVLIENEELASSAAVILSALETACKDGVQVQLAIVDNTSYESSFTAIENAGCSVHTYPDTTTGFYIHAKAVVADFGLSTQNAYIGSINYSSASMNSNRELGMFVTDAAAITSLHDTMLADYNGGTPYAAK